MTGPTDAPTPTRRLADELARTLLDADPFLAMEVGIREYDALVPDATAAAEDRLAAAVADLGARAAQVGEAGAEAVTLAAVRDTCRRQELAAAARSAEYTVSAMPITGPPALFFVLATSVLSDSRAATDYLERIRAGAAFVDQGTERLAEGTAQGRTPVGALVDQALSWVQESLADVGGSTPEPPPGWDGADAWRAEVAATVRDQLAPAVGRWRDQLRDLRSTARDDDHAGIVALPCGDAIYHQLIEYHTTVPLSAEEIHRIGLQEVDRLEDRARSLGARIGLPDLAAVRAAARASVSEHSAQESLERARAAVRRAESRAPELMPPPLPAPCAVTPMPPTVARSGMSPHYTAPRQDGGRPGTFWFNTLLPTPGTGWELEAVAFHETVPGHHSQIARALTLPDLPLLQQLPVTAHAEGWGLYAERLAGEFGLYSDERAEIGAVYTELMRAVRLVIDTGLHAFGWSRARARDYMLEHVAMAPAAMGNEVDRYIAWPGQALAYLIGQREILRLRTHAQQALGARFDLPAFNGAVLDHGAIALPVLETVVEQWIAGRSA